MTFRPTYPTRGTLVPCRVTVGALEPERRPTEAAGLVPKRAVAGQQRALNAGVVEVLKKIAIGELVADMVAR